MCVPSIMELKDAILEEAHSQAYTMHPRSTNSEEDIWCLGMKQEIANYVNGCLVYRLMKTTQFISIKATLTLDQLAKLYVDKIMLCVSKITKRVGRGYVDVGKDVVRNASTSPFSNGTTSTKLTVEQSLLTW
ncbi:retrotransposon protein, putative, Ty3-gypsy subclass [Cucumis melo var. makuwa]|uniref:Retrotransposon protein, putative, Ty3-gypsy subclass n=1 Tax=Cucumis melo var. makuwa TaxID=1194695 RepID=A0A5D3E3C9_CUCMM|nr:retrotransposon protein, putative, Ty3-gypsy subclass [Cucumis melo var. makuwa]TYK30577.1 retrotransposon protein, putative, Ty3-gypsy subclass [Cucumis melo var. makuwa]